MGRLSLAGWLLVALVAAVAWGGFATQRWLSAGARCDTKVSEAKLEAVEQERERAEQADRDAAQLFAGVRSEVRSSLYTAAAATEDRAEKIRTVYVTGQCRMPEGLPSLAPAVEEARRAAAG